MLRICNPLLLSAVCRCGQTRLISVSVYLSLSFFSYFCLIHLDHCQFHFLIAHTFWMLEDFSSENCYFRYFASTYANSKGEGSHFNVTDLLCSSDIKSS